MVKQVPEEATVASIVAFIMMNERIALYRDGFAAVGLDVDAITGPHVPGAPPATDDESAVKDPNVVRGSMHFPFTPTRAAANAHDTVHAGVGTWLLDTLTGVHVAVACGRMQHMSASIDCQFMRGIPINKPALLITTVLKVGATSAFTDARIVDAANHARVYLRATHVQVEVPRYAASVAAQTTRTTTAAGRAVSDKAAAPKAKAKADGGVKPIAVLQAFIAKAPVATRSDAALNRSRDIAQRIVEAFLREPALCFRPHFARLGVALPGAGTGVAPRVIAHDGVLLMPFVVTSDAINLMGTLHGGMAAWICSTLASLVCARPEECEHWLSPSAGDATHATPQGDVVLLRCGHEYVKAPAVGTVCYARARAVKVGRLLRFATADVIDAATPSVEYVRCTCTFMWAARHTGKL